MPKDERKPSKASASETPRAQAGAAGGTKQRAKRGGRGEPEPHPQPPREIEPRGQVNEDKGGSGAPSGGQIDGRQGDQQGIRM